MCGLPKHINTNTEQEIRQKEPLTRSLECSGASTIMLLPMPRASSQHGSGSGPGSKDMKLHLKRSSKSSKTKQIPTHNKIPYQHPTHLKNLRKMRKRKKIMTKEVAALLVTWMAIMEETITNKMIRIHRKRSTLVIRSNWTPSISMSRMLILETKLTTRPSRRLKRSHRCLKHHCKSHPANHKWMTCRASHQWAWWPLKLHRWSYLQQSRQLLHPKLFRIIGKPFGSKNRPKLRKKEESRSISKSKIQRRNITSNSRMIGTSSTKRVTQTRNRPKNSRKMSKSRRKQRNLNNKRIKKIRRIAHLSRPALVLLNKARLNQLQPNNKQNSQIKAIHLKINNNLLRLRRTQIRIIINKRPPSQIIIIINCNPHPAPTNKPSQPTTHPNPIKRKPWASRTWHRSRLRNSRRYWQMSRSR